MLKDRIDPFFYRIFVLAGMVIFLYAVYLLRAEIAPFIAAFIFAYILNPVVTRLQKRFHMRRWLAILLIYTLITVVIGGLLWWLLPLIWQQIQSAWKYFPTVIEYYNNTVRGWVTQHSPVKLPALQVKDMSMGLMDYLKQNYNITDAKSLFSYVFTSGMGVINVATFVVLIPILAFYFLFNWQERLRSWEIAIPRFCYPNVIKIVHESDEALMAFLKGQFLVMIILGIVYAVQLQLIGLNVGIIIGMVAGLASFVPYLGFTTGFIAAMIAGFFQFGMDWTHLGMIVGAFIIGQAIEGYVLQPLLLGDKIGLSALWVIFAVLAGGSLFGIVGMLVALPSAAVINVLCRHAYQAYLESNLYKGDPQLDLFSANELLEIKQEMQAKEAEKTRQEAQKREHGFLAKLKAMF